MVESRAQGSKPRPRTKKKSEAKAKDSFSEDRPSRGQGHEYSRPRPRTKGTGASVLQKNVFKIFFLAISKKKDLQKIKIKKQKRPSKKCFWRSPIERNKKGLGKFSTRFLAFSNKISTVQKIVQFMRT